ncbi:MAG: 7-carboxy-7-deazaguanine synthase QueE [Candidatus Omnitrophota bacterium]
MNAKISEIFQSIQGEGKYLGSRQVFVRFYGCHIHCEWCDTPAAIGDSGGKFREYNLKELFEEVLKFSKDTHSISLTGGEPLVQKDFLKEFLPLLKKEKYKTYLETSGILYEELKEVIDFIDIVAMDLKLPSSTKLKPFWKEHEEFLKVSLKKDVFIKAVISADTSQEDIAQAVKLISNLDRDVLFILQPNFFDLKTDVVKKCLAFQEYCLNYLSNTRVIPQMHKFLKLR